MVEEYRGVFGAFPYAFRASDSWLFRSYVAVSALVATVVTLLFGFALVLLVARTAAFTGGSLTLSRAFFVLVGLLVVAPVVAPTLFVARRHRRGDAGEDRYDVALALSGYLFLASLYVGLLVSIPSNQRPPSSGLLAPVLDVLFSLPSLAGVVPPLVAAVGIYLVHRTLR